MITLEMVKEAQSAWGTAVAGGDLNGLLGLYSENANLKPTLSKIIRRNIKDVEPYFSGADGFGDKGFLKIGINKVEFIESAAKTFENIAVDMGKYKFSFDSDEPLTVDFTFMYELNSDGKVKIVAHHSSLEVSD